MGQRFRQIGETKFALDEHGHDVLSYSASDVQSFDPVSIEFVLCRIAMVEVDLGAERRWTLDSDSQFLVEKALYGPDNGLDVDGAMSAAVAHDSATFLFLTACLRKPARINSFLKRGGALVHGVNVPF